MRTITLLLFFMVYAVSVIPSGPDIVLISPFFEEHNVKTQGMGNVFLALEKGSWVFNQSNSPPIPDRPILSLTGGYIRGFWFDKEDDFNHFYVPNLDFSYPLNKFNLNFRQNFLYDFSPNWTHVWVDEEGNILDTVELKNSERIYRTTLSSYYLWNTFALGLDLHVFEEFFKNNYSEILGRIIGTPISSSFQGLGFAPQVSLFWMPTDQWVTGITFRPRSRIDGTWSADYISSPERKGDYYHTLPWKVEGGIAIRPLPYTQLVFSVDHTHWSKYENSTVAYSSNYESVNRVHIGLELSHVLPMILRMGFYTEPYFLQRAVIPGLDQVFLTFGAGYDWKRMGIDLSIQDSSVPNLFRDDESTEATRIRVSGRYTF
jgi:long-subunit fatty acid transport protein